MGFEGAALILEAGGRAFVIRPREPLAVGRAERNKERLYAAHDQGYAGDLAGKAVWLRIMKSVGELLAKERPEGSRYPGPSWPASSA